MATANVAKVVENVLRNKIEAGWGPNAIFRFPQAGGTGGIWKGVSRLLPSDRLRFNVTVTGINAEEKAVLLSDGMNLLPLSCTN